MIGVGDMVYASLNVTGGGRVRRPVLMGEVGLVVDVEWPSETLPWFSVLLHDGVVDLPTWCVERVEGIAEVAG